MTPCWTILSGGDDVEEGTKVSERRPIVSVLLAIVAGILIMAPSWFSNDPASDFWISIVGSGWPYFVLDAIRFVTGFYLFLIAAYLYSQPSKSAKWGKVAIGVSLVRIASSSIGGLVIGAALGVIAGATAIRWGGKEIEHKASLQCDDVIPFS